MSKPSLALLLLLALAKTALAQYPSGFQIFKDGTVVLLTNYASVPLSGRGGNLTNYGPNVTLANQLGRVNFLRAEPTNAPLSATRFFVCDLNRNLYILTKSNLAFASYINFQAVFPKFDNDPGFAGGLVSFQFDPAYATNGIFYTVHTEDPAISGTASPTNGALSGFSTNGYTTTVAIDPPAGTVMRQSVLIEWRDTNVNDATFQGTARELLRIGFNSNIHPLGDLIFNPLAQPGDSDYENLYISNGDGQAGELAGDTHTIPQRLDALQGKILRITPNTNLHPADVLGSNSRYRIPSTGPDPNPFVSLTLTNLKKEIYAYGFRNPHRMSWDAVSNKLIVDDIGLNSWEEVDIIHKGTNYGYAEREGIEQLFVCSGCGTTNGLTGGQVGVAFPGSDVLTVTNGPGTTMNVTPVYPVAAYSHHDGDAIASGFVYRGSLMPLLRGKYIFGEITTGRLFYCDLAEMIAADDGNRTSMATIRELQVVFNGPYDSPDRGVSKRRLFDIVTDEYHQKGGTTSTLPGGAAATSVPDYEGVSYGSGGRADIRMAVGDDGEMYVLSKSDGMVRKLVAVVVPTIKSVVKSNTVATVTWNSVNGLKYRLQFKTNLTDASWIDALPDVTATNTTAFATNALSSAARRFYRVKLIP